MDQTTSPTPALLRLADRIQTSGKPAADRATAAMCFVDTIACIRAGFDQPQPARVLAALGPLGPITGGTLALYLGTAAHALDYDDYEEPGSTHPSAVIVPALLSLCLTQSFSVDAVLRAYVAGYEAILTLGRVLGYGHYQAGWHATSTLAGVGAAAGSARLLGLGTEQVASAMSIAMSQSAGLKQQFGSDTKALHAGFAARVGLEAAVLARAGISASMEAAEGNRGFVGLYGTESSPGWPMIEREGWPDIARYPPFRKAAPCCGYTLRAIDAALAIAAQDGFEAAKIAGITVDIAQPYHDVAGFRAPKSGHEARFSISWCIAVALARGAVLPADFSVQSLDDPLLRTLEASVVTRPYPLAPGQGDMSVDAPDTLTVTLSDGRVFVRTAAVPRGGPGLPFSREDMLAKTAGCGMSGDVTLAFLDADTSATFDPRPLLGPALAVTAET
jgi:2-methylcitrate dehydratase PrpD